MSYYFRWGLVIGQPVFQRFLRENYALGLADLKLFKRKSPFSAPDFSCLLCGVGNAATARTFIEFVLDKNPKAKICIIDLGTEQIAAAKQVVEQEFSEYNIQVRQMYALELSSWLKPSSLDWIETDGFLEFFSPKQLAKLLQIWHNLLRDTGFITIREPASSNKWEVAVLDVWRLWLAKLWLGITIYKHTLADLEKAFAVAGFTTVSFPTKVPTFRRFTMVKTAIAPSQAH
ncbi:MAG: class I SAM-dependent methyltransferase [bacterium]|nr:class I SAM-dependent methyltransferase [bacterium]